MARRNSINLNNILEAATEIVDKNGINELTLTSLAQKLEIRSPSLYNHFDGLNGLRSLLSVYGFQQLNQVLMRAAIGRSGDDAIRAMAKAYISFARSHPGLYEVTLSEPTGPEAMQVSQEIVDLVTQVLRAYRLDDAVALHMTRALRSILHGFASLEQKGGFGLPLDLDESLDEIIETYLTGLHTRFSPNTQHSQG